jgi:Na+-driven multidrug efflux pump
MKNEKEGVSLITGDPKKAILKMSGPMIFAMSLTSVYNLINAVWVAGLGEDALAAIGFVTPVFMILVGLSAGLGAGATSAISRRIGAKNKQGANNTAIHAIILTIAISVIATILLEIFLSPMMYALGAGDTTGLAVEFGSVMFLGTILILFTNVAYGILRAEGDVKRTTYAMALSAVINIILDPILIYYFHMGIAGAAWGTLISLVFVSVVLLYWFLKKKDTFVSLSLSNFTPDRKSRQRYPWRRTAGQRRVFSNIGTDRHPERHPCHGRRD